MDFEKLREHMDARFDKVEGKLDNHLDRLSKAEEAIMWMRGHLKVTTMIVISIAGWVASRYFDIIAKF